MLECANKAQRPAYKLKMMGGGHRLKNPPARGQPELGYSLFSLHVPAPSFLLDCAVSASSVIQ